MKNGHSNLSCIFSASFNSTELKLNFKIKPSFSCRYPYMAVVLNFSQMWALYCLVQFYNVTHERLQRIKPLAKFVSFKAIVFATWWQGVGIALLHEIGVLPKEGKLQTALQDFLICIEVICHSKFMITINDEYLQDHDAILVHS